MSAEKLANRPQMLQALRDAEKGAFDIFMIVYQNRLARNTTDALLIAKHFTDCGVKIWIDDKKEFVDIKDKTSMFELTNMSRLAPIHKCNQAAADATT